MDVLYHLLMLPEALEEVVEPLVARQVAAVKPVKPLRLLVLHSPTKKYLFLSSDREYQPVAFHYPVRALEGVLVRVSRYSRRLLALQRLELVFRWLQDELVVQRTKKDRYLVQ
jgi:hypothetical protein